MNVRDRPPSARGVFEHSFRDDLSISWFAGGGFLIGIVSAQSDPVRAQKKRENELGGGVARPGDALRDDKPSSHRFLSEKRFLHRALWRRQTDPRKGSWGHRTTGTSILDWSAAAFFLALRSWASERSMPVISANSVAPVGSATYVQNPQGLVAVQLLLEEVSPALCSFGKGLAVVPFGVVLKKLCVQWFHKENPPQDELVRQSGSQSIPILVRADSHRILFLPEKI